MGHIHEATGEYDQTVSAFIVLEESGKERKVLLHQHKKLGLWFQPGGHVELHENPWQAIAHELEEETGFSLEELDVLQTIAPLAELKEIVHPVPLLFRSHQYIGLAHYHTDATFGFLAKAKPNRKPAENESQILAWFTRDELEALPRESIHPDIRTLAIAILAKASRLLSAPASKFTLETPRELESREF